MNNFITIKTFTYPHEVAVLQSKLESENIECFIKDEYTINTYPFYSNALGGIKLQVKQNDLKKAIKILKEGGYFNESANSEHIIENNIFDKITSVIPIIKNLRVEFRVIFVLLLIISTLASIAYYILSPNTFERLTANIWCVDNIIYNNENFQPNTIEILKLDIGDDCTETLRLDYNKRRIVLPGFNSNSCKGAWKYEENKIEIVFTDNFNFVYKGKYKIKFKNNNLILSSTTTTILCHVQDFQKILILNKKQ